MEVARKPARLAAASFLCNIGSDERIHKVELRLWVVAQLFDQRHTVLSEVSYNESCRSLAVHSDKFSHMLHEGLTHALLALFAVAAAVSLKQRLQILEHFR